MISASTRPPMAPITIAGATTAGLPVCMNSDHGHSAAAISTTSARNDLLTVPCSVMRSLSRAGRGNPLKVRSFNPGLPDLISSFAMESDSFDGRHRGCVGGQILVPLDQRVGVVVMNRL